MSDPTEFRNTYKPTSSVKATRTTTDGLRDTWSAAVRDGSGTTLGTVSVSVVGPFATNGVNGLGPRLLDLEVVAPGPWTYSSGDNTWTSPAYSQRA